MSEIIEHYANELHSARRSLPGHALNWLNEYRDQALQQFRDHGFPAARAEDWKYTNVRPITKHQFKLNRQTECGIEASAIDSYRYRDLDCYLLVFVDGRFSASLSYLEDLADGVSIKDITTAFNQGAEALKPHLSATYNRRNGFAAMNAALMSDGAVINIERHCKLHRPIHLMFLASGQRDNITTQARILILADSGSQAQIIESYHAQNDNAYFNNIATEIKLAPNAHIEHYKIQQESAQAFHVASMQVTQQRDSVFTSHSVSLGARLARNDIHSRMNDSGASCNLYGLYVVDGRQHTDFHTRIDHAKAHCNSTELYQGILSGHSRAVFNGQVHVHPDAQKSGAEQSNNNLLLSEHAEVDTKPQLEIYADDVSASHGATIGQLDKETMFYLRSRGIDYRTAHALLVYGFAHKVIEKMSLQALREYLENTLINYIPNAQSFNEQLIK